jgi:multiple sugar transport system substrate-binding protein
MQEEMTSRKLSRRQVMKGLGLLGITPLLAACAAPAAPGTGPGPAAAPAQGTTTIEFITPGALGLERDMYTSFIEDFMEANPNIRVNVTFEAWNDYMTKLPTLLAGGVIPDMVHQHMSIVQDYAQRGALLDLIPWMERDGVNPEDYIPALFDAFSNQGRTYGIPKDSAAWGMYYNKEMFDAAGLPQPTLDWTIDEFRSYAYALTIDADGRPANDPNFDPDNIQQWGYNWSVPTPTESERVRAYVMALGGDWYDEGYTETLITSDAALETFRIFYEMRCVEHSIPTPAQAMGQGDPFRAGLTAMTMGFHTVDFFSREEEVEFDYDVTYIPGGPGGQYSVVGCSGWAVPTQASHQEEGWELVKFLTSFEVQEHIGLQKRWGVSLREAVRAIEPDDAYPEHFAAVHTDPFVGETPVDVISFKFPPQQSRIREFYDSEFDAIWTCASSDIEGAAARVKDQVDSLLAEMEW